MSGSVDGRRPMTDVEAMRHLAQAVRQRTTRLVGINGMALRESLRRGFRSGEHPHMADCTDMATMLAHMAWMIEYGHWPTNHETILWLVAHEFKDWADGEEAAWVAEQLRGDRWA